jgi:hypothetical protein
MSRYSVPVVVFVLNVGYFRTRWSHDYDWVVVFLDVLIGLAWIAFHFIRPNMEARHRRS